MGTKTHIIILRMKKLIGTLILFIALILITLLIYIFLIKKQSLFSETDIKSTYIPGIYTTSIHLGETPFQLHVHVDKEHIRSITTSSLEEDVTAMFPLLESSLDGISAQLISGVPLNDVVYDESSQYTASVILDAISIALDKASEK